MKKTLTDLSTFDWIYSKQHSTQSTRHKATAEIDHVNNDPKRVSGIVSRLIIKSIV